jgi:hypothetical protein
VAVLSLAPLPPAVLPSRGRVLSDCWLKGQRSEMGYALVQIQKSVL